MGKAGEAQKPDLSPVSDAAPDDLTRIEGIGPKISAALQQAGIRTFGQLAALEPAALQQLHPAFEEVFLEDRCHLGVTVGQHVVSTDEQGHVRSETREDVDHLDAGDPGADDDELTR